MEFQLIDYQKDLVHMARDLARREFAERAFTWEERDEYPHEYRKIFAAHGLTGMTMPESVGGQGGKLMDAVLVMEALAGICPNAADTFQAVNFGAIQQVLNLGSPEQHEKFLKPLLSGEKMITVAMSEAGAGSAVNELTTRARIEGDHVIINGAKIWNSNGPHADCYAVWVRFGDSTRDIGVVYVDRETPGLEVVPHHFMSGEQYAMLFFDDCKVPVGNILAKENAFRRMMSIFNVERMGNATRSMALGQLAFDLAVEHAKTRTQFQRRLCEFQGLQWKFAEMKLKLESARLLLYRAATNADAGLPSVMETSLAKLACNRAGFEVANEAVQILGGMGFANDSKVGYIFRRTRGWMIAGGTIEQMLNRVAMEVFGENFDQRPPRAKSAAKEE